MSESIHSTSQSSLLSRNETGCQSYPLYQRTIKSNSDKGGGNGSSIPDLPPWDTWETVEPPAKRCGMPVHLRHRQDRRRQRIIGMLCGQWDCAICGPYLKKRWLAHLIPLVADAESVHLAVVSREDWPKVYRRIRRAGGRFARVELDDEFVVFTTANEGTVLPRSIRSEVLKVAIDAATFRHKAVTTSREWKLTQKEEADSEWEKIGVLPGTVEEARQVVRKLGLQPVDLDRLPNVSEAFEVTIPESWLENDEQGFKVFVEWLLTGGECQGQDARPKLRDRR